MEIDVANTNLVFLDFSLNRLIPRFSSLNLGRDLQISLCFQITSDLGNCPTISDSVIKEKNTRMKRNWNNIVTDSWVTRNAWVNPRGIVVGWVKLGLSVRFAQSWRLIPSPSQCLKCHFFPLLKQVNFSSHFTIWEPSETWIESQVWRTV